MRTPLHDTRAGDYVEFGIGGQLIKGWTCEYTLIGKPYWIFYHYHFEELDWVNCYPIKRGKCKKCKEKFPRHKSLVLAARLQLFKNPPKI
jgi:hypothetical protein